MTRMEFLVAWNARLDAEYAAILRGDHVAPRAEPAEPIMIDDGLGGFYTMAEPAAAPAARKTYLGRAVTTGPIASTLRSDNESLFDHCPHCHK